MRVCPNLPLPPPQFAARRRSIKPLGDLGVPQLAPVRMVATVRLPATAARPPRYGSVTRCASPSRPPRAWQGLAGGDVVELFGPEGVGKSETVLNMVVNCILPHDCGGVEVSSVL